MPLSRQLSSRIQSSTVCGGRDDGKGLMSGLPSTRDRSVVLGTVGSCQHYSGNKLLIDIIAIEIAQNVADLRQ